VSLNLASRGAKMTIRFTLTRAISISLLAGCGGPASSAPPTARPRIQMASLHGPVPDLAAYCRLQNASEEECALGQSRCAIAQAWSAPDASLEVKVVPAFRGPDSLIAIRNDDGWYAVAVSFSCTDRVSSEVSPLDVRRTRAGGWSILVRSRRAALVPDDVGAIMEGMFVCSTDRKGPPSCTRELPLAWGVMPEVDEPESEPGTAAAPVQPAWDWSLSADVDLDGVLTVANRSHAALPQDVPFVRGRLCAPGGFLRSPWGRQTSAPQCEAPRLLVGAHRLELPRRRPSAGPP
jgi:hypothetical protein